MYLSEDTIKSLDSKLKKLNTVRPLSPTIINKIREQFEIEMTYNSNAIEGNTLTLKETFWVVKEGFTIKNKPLKDHLEAKNHAEALDYFYEIIEDSKNNTISERFIKELHSLIVKDSQKDIAGKYRNGDVMIYGSDHRPPSYVSIPELMEGLIHWWSKNLKLTHPIELAALIHHKFVNIHPFWDGNGRTGRLIMNIVAITAGFPLIVVLRNDRQRYYRVLDSADKGDFKPLCDFIAQAALRSLDLYLRSLAPVSQEEELLDLKELSKISPYSATYLRKLANLGKIEAFKKGRNWFSTPKNIEDYINHLKK